MQKLVQGIHESQQGQFVAVEQATSLPGRNSTQLAVI